MIKKNKIQAMELASNLSERIRQIRLQKGLSQENMADMLGLSTTAYGDVERGRTELSFSRLENIAKLLDVPLPELLGFESLTMSETEWLRQENTRLLAVNSRLQNEVEQWKAKFKLWFGEGVIRQIGEQRERIGF
jgi:transcriptional regulator with XRE-family HTH domain